MPLLFDRDRGRCHSEVVEKTLDLQISSAGVVGHRREEIGHSSLMRWAHRRISISEGAITFIFLIVLLKAKVLLVLHCEMCVLCGVESNGYPVTS